MQVENYHIEINSVYFELNKTKYTNKTYITFYWNILEDPDGSYSRYSLSDEISIFKKNLNTEYLNIRFLPRFKSVGNKPYLNREDSKQLYDWILYYLEPIENRRDNLINNLINE